MEVRSVLPEGLTQAVGEVLSRAGTRHVAHGDGDPVRAAEVVARDDDAIVLIGPFRSADVAEAVEATAPVGLPLIAPVATAAGATRTTSRGAMTRRAIAARHCGWTRATPSSRSGSRRTSQRGDDAPLLSRGEHEYGPQVDDQLRIGALPRTADPGEADVVVLAGLAWEPEVERPAVLSPLPVIAFDGVQGAGLGIGRPVTGRGARLRPERSSPWRPAGSAPTRRRQLHAIRATGRRSTTPCTSGAGRRHPGAGYDVQRAVARFAN
jgi:hypothetical protein